MIDTTITLPVWASMQRQADGSYLMIDAEHVDTDADFVAQLIAHSFNISTGENNKAAQGG